MENYATKNTDIFLSARRFPEYEEIGICRREPFQRDRDRIMHSRSFRRMMHKTQIFNANMGDHYRNRLTHTLEVAQISRSIGKVLGLNDELIEAIALGHDLGHTPFGHIGERTLDGILHNGLNTNIPATGGRFKHNFQSLKVVDQLETRCEDYAAKSTLRIRHKDCNYEITIKCPTPVQIKDNGQNERFEFCHPISSNSLSGEEAFIVEHVPSLKDKTSELKNTLTIINKREIINILAKKSEAKFEMAFDHVTYQDDSGHKAYDYQIEIELKSDYIHRVNLKMLTDDLERKVSKLESSTESKYKRGLTKLSVQ